MAMDLFIDNKGLVRCIYDESINLAALGSIDISRASHVEPTPDGQWTADMSPVAGPLLGPFAVRSEALAAERGWLERNWLPAANTPTSMCPQCGSREFAYAEYVQRMYRRCQEKDGVLVCHTASGVVNWEASKDAMLYCRQCGQQIPVPAGQAIDFV
jgi:hypothetical protein